MVWKKDVNQPIEIDEDKVSRINSAGIINITLENLWRESYSAMASGDYLKWNSKLDAIWIILGGDVAIGSDEDKQINDLDFRIYGQGSLKAKEGTGFDKKVNPNNAVQYQLLKKKSLFLRRLQNKQGKGTAYEMTDEGDFD